MGPGVRTGTRSHLGSPASGPRSGAHRGSARRASADELMLSREALARRASTPRSRRGAGSDGAGGSAPVGNSPVLRVIDAAASLPDFCSPSKRQRSDNGGRAQAGGGAAMVPPPGLAQRPLPMLRFGSASLTRPTGALLPPAAPLRTSRTAALHALADPAPLHNHVTSLAPVPSAGLLDNLPFMRPPSSTLPPIDAFAPSGPLPAAAPYALGSAPVMGRVAGGQGALLMPMPPALARALMPPPGTRIRQQNGQLREPGAPVAAGEPPLAAGAGH